MGIDLGTTGEKVVFIDSTGVVRASDSVEYPIISPKSGYGEQDPADWWNGLTSMTNKILTKHPELKDNIEAVGISGQMHTQVYLDGKGRPLRNAITWLDQRSKRLVEKLNRDREKKKKILDSTYNFLTTTYSAPNVLWVKENELGVYEKTEGILLAKDYLKYLLTGKTVTDYSDAAGTLLFDVAHKEWSPQLFKLFGLDQNLFPKVKSSKEIVGEITNYAEEETGLPSDTPVINGSADHAATSLGGGVTQSGEVAGIVGTAGVVSVLSGKPLSDPEERVFCWNYCLEDKWVNLAPMQTAGKALDWFKNTFDRKTENPFQEYNENLREVPDGSEGLIFLPYLMGERAPIWDPDARGVFFGISNSHGKYHFVKSIMEGVSFAFRQNVEVVSSLGIDIEEMKFLGGGSQSPEWVEIMAKVLNKKITPVQSSELGALGISILSGVSTGIFSNLESATSNLTIESESQYYENLSDVYRENYKKYRKLYPKLRDLFD